MPNDQFSAAVSFTEIRTSCGRTPELCCSRKVARHAWQRQPPELGTNRNAIYKNLFDARRSLRRKLAAAGVPVTGDEAASSPVGPTVSARLPTSVAD